MTFLRGALARRLWGASQATTCAVVIAIVCMTLAPSAQAAPNIVMAWGSNKSGQLGNGNPQAESDVPVAVLGLSSGATAVSAGGEQSLALLENRSAVAWGANAHGQLGDGAVTNSNVPVQLAGPPEEQVLAIAAGNEFSLALTTPGDAINKLVYGFGANASGQLGNGTETDSDVPVLSRVPKRPNEAIAISAGSEQSLALLKEGTVAAWGDNESGELGDGTSAEQSLVPVELPKWGTQAVAAGAEHSLALLDNGEVLAWGKNWSGQLGNGTTTDSDVPVSVGLTGVKAIAAGYEHSLALLANGTVRAWGDNAQGQLGDDTFADSDVPVPVCAAGATSPCSEESQQLKNVIAIAAGGEQSLALLSNGTVMAWGGNQEGQLGDGGHEDSPVPVQVIGLSGVVGIAAGETHSLAFGAPPPSPTVSGLSEQEGAPSGGTTVIVTGSNLNLATAVNFGSTPAANFTVDSPNFITAVSPAGTGTVDVTVMSAGGTSATSTADQFSYAPKVTEVSPNYGLPTGGTEVTITGRRFTGASAVEFGSTNALKFTVNSDTSITALSPPGTGRVDVTVTGPGGTSATSSSDQFNYAVPIPGGVAPTVTGVSPKEGSASGGTDVTITGTKFSGAVKVKFGATTATAFTVNAEGTSVTAISPAGTGTVDVTVTTPTGGSATSPADHFTYRVPVPTVTGLTPDQGPQHYPSESPVTGTYVAITGTNFFQTTAVDFGEAAATSFTPVSEDMIIALAPEWTGFCPELENCSVNVTVLSPGGRSATTSASKFTYDWL